MLRYRLFFEYVKKPTVPFTDAAGFYNNVRESLGKNCFCRRMTTTKGITIA